MNFQNIEGATPLDQDEIDGLIPRHIKFQSELNEWELENIISAETWLLGLDLSPDEILMVDFVLNLHVKMFDQTWKWAGNFRRSAKNIGVESYKIQSELKNLLDDVQYQIKNKTYAEDEILLRLHHRLVFIHCFANGNGRHARLYTDTLAKSLRLIPFSWGKVNLSTMSETRKLYIQSLRMSDKGDYSFLRNFIRS